MVIYQNKHYRKQNKYTSYKQKKKIHYSLGNKDFQRKPFNSFQELIVLSEAVG